MSLPPTTKRPPGLLISVDGPGGVGKSTVVELLAHEIHNHSIPVCVTTNPSRTDLGGHIRHGTHTYRGMALACLVAGDRHHQLATEILPALHAGTVVICDRYVPSSLVLQGMDGIDFTTVWALNAGVYVPDVAVILNADPSVIASRLHQRGTHSRFELQPGSSHDESHLYDGASAELQSHGWPVVAVDCTTDQPDTIAAKLADIVINAHAERSKK